MAIPTETASPVPSPPAHTAGWKAVSLRLFLTCWAIYALHASPFVVRELYLTMSLAERSSVRVNEYLGLHPDLFELAGRGAFVGGNPGVAFLAAVPYRLALPLIVRVAPIRPRTAAEDASAVYKEQRPNRLAFYKEVRERGLDIRLGAAAMFTSVFFMAPLAAFSAVVVFWILACLGFTEKESLWFALLYSLGTPIFFRAPMMNQNLMVALLGLFSFALLWRPSPHPAANFFWRYFAAGLFAGYCVLTDYTGVITVAVLGLFLLVQESGRGFSSATKNCVPFVAGALIPVGVLLLYQWYCFGSPWWPAQYYMPREVFRGYPSEYGFGTPRAAALWGLLFDPLYGMFVFCPILGLAACHPLFVRRGMNRVPSRVAMLAWIIAIAFWVFCASIHYTLRHQWQDGFRYLVPVVPFLFLLVADVLARIPRTWALLLAAGAVFETWCLAMVREAPLVSISRVVREGLELPWLGTLVKAAPQYLPALAQGASPLPLFIILFIFLRILWRTGQPARQKESM